MDFFTIGVYNSTERDFFGKLKENQIDMFCDVRQRRGVRGSKYAFVNSKRLQARLNDLGIKYLHIPELAPTTEIREMQKVADCEKGETKRGRVALSSVFVAEYRRKILEFFDFDSFEENLLYINASRIVFFCVEASPDACHRSLVAERLSNRVTHL